ncbi:MAG: DNA-binding protein [Chloroflexi bacterium]|nr:MAG: DNA-binding protein [Chloroflexota bacterium]
MVATQVAEENWLSVDEVAERLGKHIRTIQRWCDRGDIFEGTRKSGPFNNSQWRIPETAVIEFEQKYGVN